MNILYIPASKKIHWFLLLAKFPWNISIVSQIDSFTEEIMWLVFAANYSSGSGAYIKNNILIERFLFIHSSYAHI